MIGIKKVEDGSIRPYGLSFVSGIHSNMYSFRFPILIWWFSKWYCFDTDSSDWKGFRILVFGINCRNFLSLNNCKCKLFWRTSKSAIRRRALKVMANAM